MILQVSYNTYIFVFYLFTCIYFVADRARDLSKYCDDLLKLPRYLSESSWVQDQLFGIHEGDIETDLDPSASRPASSNNYNNTPTTPMSNTNEYYTDNTPKTPSTPGFTSNNGNTTIKVKIIYKDEIFAIKVPVNSTIEFLQSKILDRLGFDVDLKYKDGERLIELNRETFESAVKLGKLTVVAS